MLMPFGKWKGRDMDNVPAEYLDWLVGQEWIIKFPDVVQYIKDHKESIHQELLRKGKLDDGNF
jgi:hypothetical protein